MKTIIPKQIGVLGASGMLGADLVSSLSRDYKVISITKENYSKHIGKSFAVLINANGNSRRWWANQNPVEDFSASTLSVIKSIFDFPSKTYIYVSSVDVYIDHDNPRQTKETSKLNVEKLDPYGLHKYLSEQLVKKYCPSFLILRPSSILGTNLKKGPIYDSLSHKSVLITPDSRLQFITALEIGNIIHTLIKKRIHNQTVNVGGKGSYELSNLPKLIPSVVFSKEAVRQTYEMNIVKLKRIYPRLRSSKEYLEDFLTSRI